MDAANRVMKVIESHPTVDRLLETWEGPLGRDFLAYRNHAYRVLNFAAALSGARREELEKLAVAAAFHDVGIWLDATFDYLEPSVRRAQEFLVASDHAEWVPVVGEIIREHHKVLPWHGPGADLVEAFRRADWLDVCLFCLPTRLERRFLQEVRGAFPRSGFHRRLVELTWWWAKQHPFRPLPMFRI